MPDDKKRDRRSFFRQLFLKGAEKLHEATEKVAQQFKAFEPPPPPPPAYHYDERRYDGTGTRYLRPPGALPQPAFGDTCSRCGDCVKACPAQAIKLDFKAIRMHVNGGEFVGADASREVIANTSRDREGAVGSMTRSASGKPLTDVRGSDKAPLTDVRGSSEESFTAGGLPYIIARESPCVICTDLSCMKACPTGALRKLDTGSQIQMGYAMTDQSRCIRGGGYAIYDEPTSITGEDCRICVTSCPLGADAIGIDGHGTIEIRHGCVGCGVCEQVCPTEQPSVWVEPW